MHNTKFENQISKQIKREMKGDLVDKRSRVAAVTMLKGGSGIMVSIEKLQCPKKN